MKVTARLLDLDPGELVAVDTALLSKRQED